MDFLNFGRFLMARIFYVHWNKDEAAEVVRELREAGHSVNVHWDQTEGAGNDAWNKIRSNPPDALVVSLARLPSHGRRIAAVTIQTKKLRDVPVIFVDGEKDKIAVARQQFPEAKFVSGKKLVGALAKIKSGENENSGKPDKSGAKPQAAKSRK